MARIKPKIAAVNPVVIPARQELVYDHWETQDVHLTDNGNIITGYITWRRCRYMPVEVNSETRDVREFAPNDVPNPTAQLPLDNFDALIEADVDFGAGRDLIVGAAVRRAKALGILT
jgi:hypothetical protein